VKPSVCFLSILFLVGCVLPEKSTVSEGELIGQFCHSSIDAALCLTLKADHTYTESFSNAGGNVRVGDKGELVVPTEPRGSGVWRLEGNRVLLFPATGKKRTLGIEQVGGSIRLHEANGKYSREYRS
jgi:hypothetical protein